jgi:AhpD family alkylhydroperoxidase
MPKILDDFKGQFPKAWAAYEELRNACNEQGPLDAKTIELIKIGVSVGVEQEGGVTAHISRAKKAGANNDEIYHAILSTTGQAGFPAVLSAYAAAKAYLEK